MFHFEAGLFQYLKRGDMNGQRLLSV